MTSYWLRTNKLSNWNWTDNDFQLWDTIQTRKYSIGDKIIIYITDDVNNTDGKWLVGLYEFLPEDKLRPIIHLPQDKWLDRPPVEEWKKLLEESIKQNTPFDINNNSSWVGKVASQGLKLTEEDFSNLVSILKN